MNRINTIIIVAITLFIIPFIALATDGYDYYYSGGKKVFLKRNPDKVNIVSFRENNTIYLDQIDANDINSYSNVIYDNNLCLKYQSTQYPTIHLPCYINSYGENLYSTNYINIKLKSPSDITKLLSKLNKYNLQLVSQDIYMPLWYTITITSETSYDTMTMCRILYESNLFDECEPDFLFNSQQNISYDKLVNNQWNLYNNAHPNIDINASSAWNIATGKGVLVAIIDSGIDLEHIDLKNNIYYLNCDFDNFEPGFIFPQHIYSNDGHGTHVAGIVAAERNNGIDIAGVAPDAKIMSISGSMHYISDYANKISYGINWAWKNGADVINCSWRSYPSERISEAIDSAILRGRKGKGSIITFISGNQNDSIINFPARCNPKILTVGAIGQDGQRAYFSNYGLELDIVAPGVDIFSTLLNDSTGYLSGTSMAAPHVAGLAALILERNPDLTGQQVRDIIEQNTTKVEDIPYTTVPGRPNGTWNKEYGYGLIDAYKALLATPRKEENY